jgi:multisubunit Na+/H+ antiporter MnhB subunit
MIEFAAFASSFVTIFVLSSATRNKRHGRRNSKMLDSMGYFLCGLLFATAAILLLVAVTGWQLNS